MAAACPRGVAVWDSLRHSNPARQVVCQDSLRHSYSARQAVYQDSLRHSYPARQAVYQDSLDSAYVYAFVCVLLVCCHKPSEKEWGRGAGGIVGGK